MTTTHNTTLVAPLSVGELFDKITILRIKSRRITDQAKLANVNHELQVLERAAASIPAQEGLPAEIEALLDVNQTLWDIEDDIRACERANDFSDTFIQLARSVYIQNDERARIKRRINELCGSALVEEKSYAAY
ncbi:MAG: DUF6165 family protein [Pseudohongiella sp.]|nr:DUF6165 family protein [Pseudohongiella sp.]